MALQSFSKLFGGDSESMQMIRSNIEFDRLQFVCVCVRSSLPIVYTKFYSNKYTEWKDMEVLL